MKGRTMKLMKQLLAMATIAFATAAQAAPATEAPDVLVKRISQDVIDTAKADAISSASPNWWKARSCRMWISSA